MESQLWGGFGWWENFHKRKFIQLHGNQYLNNITKCFPYGDIGKTLIITISSNLTLNQLVIRFKLWLIIAFYSKQYFSFYLWAWCPCHNCICIIVYIWGHNMISLCNPDVNGGKFKVTCSKWCHHNQNKQMLQLTNH